MRKTMLLLLLMMSLATSIVCDKSICDEPMCTCDRFRRVICNCTESYQELTVRPEGAYKMMPTAKVLEVYDCPRVHVMADAVKNIFEFERMSFANIGLLMLSENSFHWLPETKFNDDFPNGIQVSIENSTILEMPSYLFKGRIDDVKIKSVNIHLLRSFAFSSISETKTIEIRDSHLTQVDAQAFKKFSTESFIIFNNTFNELPSRTLSDLEIRQNFIFNNNRLEGIRSSFAIVTGPTKLDIENNDINVMEGEAFRVTTSGHVFVSNNVIKDLRPRAFSAINVFDNLLSRYGRMDFKLVNNSVSELEPLSLMVNTTSFNFLPKDIMLDQYCECHKWQFNHPAIDEAFYCKDGDIYSSWDVYKKTNCQIKSINIMLLSISVVIAAIVVISIILLAIFLYRKYCKRKQDNYGVNNKPNQTMVIPDGKTYKETELYVVVEKAELLTTDL